MNHDAFEILEDDHANLKLAMQDIEESINDNKSDIKELFKNFLEVFELHDKKEDQIVYPFLKEYPQLTQLVLKSYQAHHIVKVGIMELRLLPFRSETWGPKFLVIKDCILKHMEEEETILFEDANQLLDEENLESLCDQLNEKNYTEG